MTKPGILDPSFIAEIFLNIETCQLTTDIFCNSVDQKNEHFGKCVFRFFSEISKSAS